LLFERVRNKKNNIVIYTLLMINLFKTMKMKKIFAILCLLTLTSSYTYSQYGWSTIIDYNNLYINGTPVRALYNDIASNTLLIGGKVNFLSHTSGGPPCCSFCLYLLNNNVFRNEVCEAPLPFIGSGTDTSCILSFASAYDSTMQQDFYAIGGRFTDEWCGMMDAPTDFHNLIINPANVSYLWDNLMSCSDTVFAVAMLANKRKDSCDTYFKTYVAAKCAFCNSQVPSSIDSSRYIAYFGTYQGCNLTDSINYMQGGTNGPVYALRAIDTLHVFAGGRFDSAGVIKAHNIAKWNGIGWDSLGSGTNGVVKVLHTFNGKLYAGGSFAMAGGNAANNIAEWDGTQWSALGAGTNGTVNALTVYNGNLYAGGAFTQADGNIVNYIAKWDGTNWSDVAGGRNDEIFALATFQGGLYAGGKFSGGINDTARYLAKYIDSTYTGLTEISKNICIAVFPNPTTNNLIIVATQQAVIEITNIQGQLIKTFAANEGKTSFDVSELPSGVYVVEVRTEKGVEVRKFIKE
jgi:hypothetical protein